MARTRFLLSFVVAAALFFTGAIGANLRTNVGTFKTTFRMQVGTSGAGRVFTRERAGYSEADSTRFALASGDGMRSYVVLSRPRGAVGVIRLDPGSSEGVVQFESIDFSWRGKTARLTGRNLRKAIRPLHQLDVLPSGTGTTLRATGSDPFLEVAIPDVIAGAMKLRERLGLALVVIATCGLLWLCWWMRRDVVRGAARALRTGDWRMLVVASLSTLAVLSVLGYGCEGMCSPRGAGFGMLLLAASLALALVGQVLLRRLHVDTRVGPPRLFLSIIAGQAIFVVYIGVRSAIHAWVPVLPLTSLELFVLVLSAAVLLWHDTLVARTDARNMPTFNACCGWSWIELALLVGVCVVIGERELPRLLMLSSDPDTHAYFARQLEVTGGVPWRGGSVFHYPMGTAVLGFLWAKLAFLDVRNAVTALPLLQAFLAALVLAESFALRVRSNAPALVLFLLGLGATTAGFLIPLYSSYAHMEGAGRQMAAATLTLVPAVLIAPRKAGDLSIALLMLLSAFVLAVLNPLNIVIPLVLLAGYGLHQLLLRRRLSWWSLVPVALLPMLLIDPSYFELTGGTGRPESRFTVDAALQVKPLSLVLAQWMQALGRGPQDFLRGNGGFVPGQAPVFVAFVASLLAVLFWLHRWPPRRVFFWAMVSTLLLTALWAVDALFDVLVDDRRFYLLAPYYWLSLAQAKILLVTSLLLAAGLAIYRRRLSVVGLIAFAVIATASTALTMHQAQDFMERPRVDYCGSLGCMEADDFAVLTDFQALHLAGKLRAGRVLLPNSRHSAHREQWIFPVTAARGLPFFDTPPPAFFYYQGDSAFTTANYVSHVCRSFDREWLREHSIAYVFLPQRRGDACVQGMETLPRSERVVVQHGDSMVIELR